MPKTCLVQLLMCLKLSVIISCCEIVKAFEPNSRWKPDTILVSESLSTNSFLPVVSVKVSGKPCRLLLNTNMFVTQLDKSLCIGLKPFHDGAREPNPALEGLLIPPPLELGSMHLKGVRVVRLIDCTSLTKETGEEIQGTLGMDALRELVLQIDADHDVLQIASPSLHDPPPGVHFPLDIGKDLIPRVVCTVAPGHFATFEFDIGSYDNGSIDRSTADYVRKNGGVAAAEPRGVLAPNGFVRNLDAVKVPKVECGNIAFTNLLFSVGETNCFGMDSLLRCRITFDFQNKRVYCLPSKLMKSFDRNTQFGMTFDDKRPLFTVSRVGKGLAADAGITPGDRIISINGTDVETHLMKAYRSLCAPSLIPAVLEVDRAGRRATITIRSEN